MWRQVFGSSKLNWVLRYGFSKIDKKPDLYVLLELKPTATQEQIRYNYFKLMAKYNPSNSSDPPGHSKLLNQAYVILSNQKLKEKYDRENGFVGQKEEMLKAANSTSNEFLGRPGETESFYNKAKNGVAEFMGDKVTRLKQRLTLIVAALLTMLLVSNLKDLVHRDSKKPQNKVGFSIKEFEKTFNTKIEGL